MKKKIYLHKFIFILMPRTYCKPIVYLKICFWNYLWVEISSPYKNLMGDERLSTGVGQRVYKNILQVNSARRSSSLSARSLFFSYNLHCAGIKNDITLWQHHSGFNHIYLIGKSFENFIILYQSLLYSALIRLYVCIMEFRLWRCMASRRLHFYNIPYFF